MLGGRNERVGQGAKIRKMAATHKSMAGRRTLDVGVKVCGNETTLTLLSRELRHGRHPERPTTWW